MYLKNSYIRSYRKFVKTSDEYNIKNEMLSEGVFASSFSSTCYFTKYSWNINHVPTKIEEISCKNVGDQNWEFSLKKNLSSFWYSDFCDSNCGVLRKLEYFLSLTLIWILKNLIIYVWITKTRISLIDFTQVND